MFYGAKSIIFIKAAELRRNMTLAEKVLWKVLNNKKDFPARWKRQHPVDIFILDFYCHKYKLSIEVDGEIHEDDDIGEHDAGREHDITKLGIKIIRITNKEVFENIEFVKRRIISGINCLILHQKGAGSPLSS